MSRLRTLAGARKGAGPFFVVAGALHFVKPAPYKAIMPPWVPAHDFMVAASGIAEIVGGAGLMASSGPARRWSSWWLVATLVAVFPANLHMALHPERFPQVPGGRRALWSRLPLQGLLIAWVLDAAGR